MFSFLKPQPALRLGVELGRDNWVGMLLDSKGIPQKRHQQSAPGDGERSQALQSLLGHFPIKGCQVVLGLPPEYHWKCWELESRRPLDIRYESERWLPYSASEASFAWHALGPKNTLISSYPSELLHPLNAAVAALGPCSLAWEVPEMAYLRTLNRAGTATALVDVKEGWLQVAVAAEGEFYAVLQPRTKSQQPDPAGLLESVVNFLLCKRKTAPTRLLTNAPAEQLSGWECQPLPSDYLAIELANSPAGPHQFKL